MDPTPPAVLPPPHPDVFNLPLHVDGIVGPNTWGRLDPPEIKKNSAQHPYVKLCQLILKSFSNPLFDPGPADGIFGDHTEAAVKAFQTAFALSPDGIVGPKTWLVLHS
jgi:peptidoglycan hydrolase-like protein with peptidoglycan-binding domain